MFISRMVQGGLCALLVVPVCWAGVEAPVAVSPGNSTGAMIGDVCPTFSWGAFPDARTYELVVYRLGDRAEEAESVLMERIAGSALGWTPSLDRCLEWGGKYAWTVRATGGKKASDWSRPMLFEVISGASEAEFERALDVVQRYLSIQGKPAIEKHVDAETRSGSQTELSGQAPEAPAPPAATLLSVNGNVDAASFSGDGSSLTALDPASLSAGTAAIDISGTATNVTGTVVIARGGTGASDPAGARTNLGVAAGPHTSDTDTTCDGVPCDGTHFSNLDWHSLLNRPAGLVLPRGTIVAYVGTVVPAGWALCDGGTYTAPDGDAVTTPDLRNRFLYGHSSFPVPQYSYGGTSSHAHGYTDYILATHPNPGPDLVSTIFYGVKGDTWAGDGVRITVEGSFGDGSGCGAAGCAPPPGTDPASVYTFTKSTDVQAHEPPFVLVTFIMKL